MLSKPQAVLRFAEGHFLIKDLGSSNGTFINNFRLSKAGLESEETRIYSDDVLKLVTRSIYSTLFIITEDLSLPGSGLR